MGDAAIVRAMPRTVASSLQEYWNHCADPWSRRSGAAPDAEAAALLCATAEVRHAFAALRPGPGDRVLELGCGTGSLTVGLAATGADVTGLDVAPRRLAIARRTLDHAGASGTRLVQGDAAALPWADGSFDAVFARDLLMYGDPDRLVDEAARVARPGGRVVFAEALRGPWLLRVGRRLWDGAACRAVTRHRTPADIEQALQHSLHIERRTFFYCTAALPYALYLATRRAVFLGGAARMLTRLDRALFDRMPATTAWAWRVVYAARRAGSAAA